MRVGIDKQRCQGHNVCLSYIPDLLDADEVGFVSVRGEGVVSDADRPQAILAYQNCPEQAIALDEDS
jgi:ferredoxin